MLQMRGLFCMDEKINKDLAIHRLERAKKDVGDAELLYKKINKSIAYF